MAAGPVVDGLVVGEGEAGGDRLGGDEVPLNAGPVLDDPLPLASGRKVWVTAGWEEIARGGPQRQAVGSMIEPAFPEAHDVSSPGIFVKGVHWSDAPPID